MCKTETTRHAPIGHVVAVCGLAITIGSLSASAAPVLIDDQAHSAAVGRLSGESAPHAAAPPLAQATIIEHDAEQDIMFMPAVFSDDEPSQFERDNAYELLHDALHTPSKRLAPVDYTGQTPFAETVRYVEDFEDASRDRPEWDALPTRSYEGMSRVAGPFKTGGASIRIETKPGELYTFTFDVALIGARIGDPAVSNQFVVRADDERLLDRPIREFTQEAIAARESFDDPPIVEGIQLFFRASYPITTLTFEGVEAGEKGGEIWGVDNIIIDRVTMNPAETEDVGFTPYVGGGGGASGPVGGALNLPRGGTGGASSGGGRDGGSDGGRPDIRLPDLIPPRDPPTTPAPDLPPSPPQDPPSRPTPPSDPPTPPEPPTPPTPPTPEVPAPGATVLFGLSALMLNRRRRSS